MYDYLIVGAGLFGATFARIMTDAGKKCLVLDRRNHIAGNVYTLEIEGVNVHRYGAHIFHTNDRQVWDFVNRYATFNRFTNSPVANYKGEIYSLPFNMYTFNQMWGVTTPEEARAKIEEQRSEFFAGVQSGYGNDLSGKADSKCSDDSSGRYDSKSDDDLSGRPDSISGNDLNGGADSRYSNDSCSKATWTPRNLEEQAISLVGRDIYEKLVKGYTEKQWGRKCTELPAFIIRRLPVRFTYDNNYFNALYQGIPIGGYTKLVENLLKGIDVELGVDYLDNKEKYDNLAGTIIYTGAIDEYFGYKLGNLEYRSVRFEDEILDTPNFQGNAAVNYTDAETPWTRIIEHKWFEFGKDEAGNDLPKTVISKEYSAEWKPGDEPYYPVNDERNTALYAEYRKLAGKELVGIGPKVIFGGRLGQYKYYDMDQVIRAAMDAASEAIG